MHSPIGPSDFFGLRVEKIPFARATSCMSHVKYTLVNSIDLKEKDKFYRQQLIAIWVMKNVKGTNRLKQLSSASDFERVKKG